MNIYIAWETDSTRNGSFTVVLTVFLMVLLYLSESNVQVEVYHFDWDENSATITKTRITYTSQLMKEESVFSRR